MVWIENSYVKSGGAWRSGPGFRLIMTMPRLMASLFGVTTYKNIIIIIVEHNSHDGWSWPCPGWWLPSLVSPPEGKSSSWLIINSHDVDHDSWQGYVFPSPITHHHDPEVISSSIIILSGLGIRSFALSLFALSLYSLFTKRATGVIHSLKRTNCTCRAICFFKIEWHFTSKEKV